MTFTERFNDRLPKVRPTKKCWRWGGPLNPSGYGTIFFHGKKNTTAHRASYMLNVGQIPKGKHILHKCDNRDCVNPRHLYAGTHDDNMRDRTERKRGYFQQPGWKPTHTGKTKYEKIVNGRGCVRMNCSYCGKSIWKPGGKRQSAFSGSFCNRSCRTYGLWKMGAFK